MLFRLFMDATVISAFMGVIFDDKKFRYSPLNIAGRFYLDAVDENFAVAGYANAVAFIELSGGAPVDCETALDNCAVDTFAFEADFVEIF